MTIRITNSIMHLKNIFNLKKKNYMMKSRFGFTSYLPIYNIYLYPITVIVTSEGVSSAGERTL